LDSWNYISKYNVLHYFQGLRLKSEILTNSRLYNKLYSIRLLFNREIRALDNSLYLIRGIYTADIRVGIYDKVGEEIQ
jgi:hypothetical protein